MRPLCQRSARASGYPNIDVGYAGVYVAFATAQQWSLTSYPLLFHHLASASMNPTLSCPDAVRDLEAGSDALPGPYVLLVRCLSFMLNFNSREVPARGGLQ